MFLADEGLQVGGLAAILAASWRSWDHLGSKLGGLGTILAPSWRSWGHLGSNLEGLGSILLATWGHLGSKLGIWRASWLQDRHQIASCMQLVQHSKNIEKSMKTMSFSMFLGGGGAPSWRSWGHLGSKLEVLGPSWLQVGRSWRHLGSNLRVQSENIEKPLVFQGSGGGEGVQAIRPEEGKRPVSGGTLLPSQ